MKSDLCHGPNTTGKSSGLLGANFVIRLHDHLRDDDVCEVV